MFKVDFDAVIGGKINDIGWLSWPDPNVSNVSNVNVPDPPAASFSPWARQSPDWPCESRKAFRKRKQHKHEIFFIHCTQRKLDLDKNSQG
jgi:hypothetical protein